LYALRKIKKAIESRNTNIVGFILQVQVTSGLWTSHTYICEFANNMLMLMLIPLCSAVEGDDDDDIWFGLVG
jgi:hypothetical protein